MARPRAGRREDTPFNPSTPYACVACGGRHEPADLFCELPASRVFTRAANVYGPGQQLYRIIPRTIVAAMGGQKLQLDGGGKSVRGCSST